MAAPPAHTLDVSAWPSAPPYLALASAGCGLAALAVYVVTLSPSVSCGDSGEMIAVAHTLGVAHPPGYPLYALLAKAFALLPLGGVAPRINLFSAVCDALAASLLCGATARLAGSVWPGVLAAAMFAFSPLVWPYAITAEVFALNNLFVAALLWLSTRVESAAQSPEKRWRYLTAMAFTLGLGLSNHHILVLLFGPILALHVILPAKAHLTRAPLAKLALAFVLGLTPYVYLLIAPHFGSEIAWGDTGTPAGFVDHVLRREYGTLQLADATSATSGGAGERLAALAARLTSTTAGLAPLLLLAGLPVLFGSARIRTIARVWTIGLGVHLLVFSSLSNLSVTVPVHAAVQERFWQQAVLVLAALMGLGLAKLAAPLPRWRSALTAVIALGVSLALPIAHFRSMDQRQHTFFRDYGQALLDSLPRDAVLLITSDEAIGSVRYLQQVEGLRRDVRALPTGQITSPWFRSLAARHFPGLLLPPVSAGGHFTCREFLDRNLPAARIFLVNKVPWLATLEEAYSPVPVGLADEILPKQTLPPFASWVDEGVTSFARFDPGAARRRHDGPWERYVQDNYWRQFERFALAVSSAAHGHGEDPRSAELVVRALAPVADRHPRPSPTILRNLGVAYQFLARRDPAARASMVHYWKRYLEVAPPGDPARDTIAGIVRDAAATPEPGSD